MGLESFLKSLIDQIYPRWELLLICDAVEETQIHSILSEFSDTRVKTFYSRETSLTVRLNKTLASATGDYILFVEKPGCFSSTALYLLAEVIERKTDVQILYGDDDCIDATGNRLDPHFKPSWNPDLLLSHYYPEPLVVYHRNIMKKINAFRSNCEGGEFYDLILRATEIVQEDRICHVPYILYHRFHGISSFEPH